MPSSAVRTFSDPYDYAAAMRAVTTELTVTGRGRFAAKLVRIDLHRMWMQRLSDNLPRVLHAAHDRGRAIITFGTGPGPGLLAGGLELLPSTLVRHSEGHEYHQLSSGAGSFGALSLPVEEWVSLGDTFSYDLTPPRDALVLAPSPAAMARLQRLHAAAGRLAEDAPEIIDNADAARGLEQQLIEAVLGCLAQSQTREDRVARQQHELIMRRFRRVVEEHQDQPLYIPEVCRAIRVPERTLLACCHEHLGMGPKRYLQLRRLYLARQALRQAAPHTTTVTQIATRFGFWQFGRFAGAYRLEFGESPSTTLLHPAE